MFQKILDVSKAARKSRLRKKVTYSPFSNLIEIYLAHPNEKGRYKINLEEYTQSLPPNEQGDRPPIPSEEAERIWLDVVGGPKKGIAYDLADKSFWRYRVGLQGIGISAQGEVIDRSAILSMEQKIANLTAELEESKAREKKQLERSDERFNLLQSQVANLLASGGFPIPRSPPPSPCAGDENYRSEDEDEDDATKRTH